MILVGLAAGIILSRQSFAKPPEDQSGMEYLQEWSSPAYVRWLEERSMLGNAHRYTDEVTGHGIQWRETYAKPETREIVAQASVWVLGYPGSMITRPGESVIHSWGDEALWAAFEQIGIHLLHTGPVKRSGGIRERRYTPTVDGWFDRISLGIDPALGTEAEYRRMVKTAAAHRGLIAGDLVPLHTGKGADFLLALRNYRDYPGMYALVEIERDDWKLLPEVDDPWDSAPVSRETVEVLRRKGYLPGSIDSADAVKEARQLSGWDATGKVLGVDGKVRRWVYLHYFKPGQPTLNWLDPTFAAYRVVAADSVKTIHHLGARVVRLDAVPFLGIEPREDSQQAWGYQHPLAPMATNSIAFLIRKFGGWSFQELNLPYEQLKAYSAQGPDLSYDFFTRTESLHALLSGDASLLRLAYREMLKAGLDPVGLVHDLQNHDEITYQLVQLQSAGEKPYPYHGQPVAAQEIRRHVLEEMREKAAGPHAPYNHLYRPERDGVATTFCGFIAASLGIENPYQATEKEKALILQGHLLLTTFNALQPGVFSLSGWDLVGALPLPAAEVEDLLHDDDFRWTNRGAIDLMDVNPDAEKSAWGLPRAKVLYGPLPQQLADPDSYVSRLKAILKVRQDQGIHLAEVIAVPEPNHKAVFLLVMRLPRTERIAVAALNFGREKVVEKLDFGRINGLQPADWSGKSAWNTATGKKTADVCDHSISLALDGWAGNVFILK
ncbi:MAG: hypothetical protein JXB10_12345 [Pirellulales bacterium]|nr:hypothetical protein [Pirellulales bacterium]